MIENVKGYRMLAAAIVLQAVKDYRYVLKQIRKGKTDPILFEEKEDLEEWFRSDQFAIFTDIDPEFLIWKLKKEVGLA